MLQLPHAREGGKVQRLSIPSISTRLHGMRTASIRVHPANNLSQIQTGDPTGTGAGGQSYWGTPFRDEHDLRGAAKHDGRGTLAMANKGAGTNGSVLRSYSIPVTDQRCA